MDELDSRNGLQFVHINARSVFHKLDTLRYEFLRKSIDILGVSETWLNPQINNDMISIPGFDLLRNDRSYGRGGGTCVYIRQGIGFAQGLRSHSDVNIEIQNVTLTGERTNQNLKPIELVLLYRPPKGNDRLACDQIKLFLNGISDLDQKELILMGDLNWDMLEKWGVGLKMITEIQDEFSLYSYITTATRITSNRESLLDIILANLQNVHSAGCVNFAISDHFPVYLIKKKN